MKIIAMIRENDEADGNIIGLGYAPFTDDEGAEGFRLVAENGDDIGYFRAQTAQKCQKDIIAQWGQWKTYATLN